MSAVGWFSYQPNQRRLNEVVKKPIQTSSFFVKNVHCEEIPPLDADWLRQAATKQVSAEDFKQFLS
jgi:hypothetical protein